MNTSRVLFMLMLFVGFHVITSIGLDELQELLGEVFRSASLHRFVECSDNSFPSTTIICLVVLLSFMKWKFHIICNDKVIEQLVVDIALSKTLIAEGLVC
jgi:hypothetical protein